MVVVDDFYRDPTEIRRIALGKPFFQYHLPTPDQVGIIETSKFAGLEPCWFSTALVRAMGEDVHDSQRNHEAVKQLICALSGS